RRAAPSGCCSLSASRRRCHLPSFPTRRSSDLRGAGLGEHAARLAAHQGFSGARPGVLQGTYTYVLQNEDGQIATTHSISAGLDRSEEHTSELQSRGHLVCRLLLEKKNRHGDTT